MEGLREYLLSNKKSLTEVTIYSDIYNHKKELIKIRNRNLFKNKCDEKSIIIRIVF